MNKLILIAAALMTSPAFAASGPFLSLHNTNFIVLIAFVLFVVILLVAKVPAKLGAMLDGFRLWDLWLVLSCGLGAFVMRGAGCTWNDITDREFDGRVARTRSRPIRLRQGCRISCSIRAP